MKRLFLEELEKRIEVPCPCGENEDLFCVYSTKFNAIGKIDCPVCGNSYYFIAKHGFLDWVSEAEYEEVLADGSWEVCDDEEVFPAVDKEEKCVCEEEDRMSGLRKQING